MQRVLFVCVENACRSQMAEGFARHYGGGRWQVFSAGSRPAAAVDPQAIAVMRERGIALGTPRPKGLAELPDVEYDVVVTMGCGEACPAVRAKRHEAWTIPDPKGMPLEGYRQVRDTIERHVRDLLAREAPRQER